MNNIDGKSTTQSATVVKIDDATFGSEVLRAAEPVLVDFVADWCRPCKVMEPIFGELAGEYAGRVKFARLDVDENPDAASTAGVLNLPTFVLFNRGRIVATGFGTKKIRDMRAWIDEGLAKAGAARQ